MKRYKDYLKDGVTRDLPEHVLVNDYFLRVAKHLSSESVAQFIVNTILDFTRLDAPVATIYKELFYFCPELDQFVQNKLVYQSRAGMLNLASRFAWTILNEWPNAKFPAMDAPLIAKILDGEF